MQRPTRTDTTIVLALLGLGLFEVLVTPLADDVVAGPAWLNVLAVAALAVPLLIRRRAPLAATIAVFGALAGRSLYDEQLETYQSILCGGVAVWSLALHATWRDTVAGVAVAVLALGVTADRGTGGDASVDWLPACIFVVIVVALGRAARSRHDRAAALESAARARDSAREEEARAAAAAERERIARELHDAVSHSLAVIVTQAGGAQSILDTHPDRARQSLASIERSAREGLVEMRRLLGLLRPGDQAAELVPQPGLAALPELVERTRAAGIAVSLDVDAHVAPLPAGVDLSAYRIVQEALTNAMRHAGARRVDVAVRRLPGRVELEVADDGTSPAGGGSANGRGLTGMRERVELLGGRLETGAAPGGGFRVRANLPVDGGTT